MKKKQESSESGAGRTATHLEHLEAQEEHALWMRDLERWQQEHRKGLERFVARVLPDLEIANFLEALDRHEAAILAHQELVDRHEQRLRHIKTGQADEADELHQQMHERHEASRRQHEALARSHHAILEALSMFEHNPPK